MNKDENIFITNETAFAVDRDGRIIAWNPAAEKTFGFPENEALGQSCWELLSGQDIFGNPMCCEGCPIRASAFRNEPINRFQIYFRTASNQRKHFSVSNLMLFNTSGEGILVHLCTLIPEAGITASTLKTPSANSPSMDYPHKELTHRETEVLMHLHEGKTIKNIAETLNISPSTVRNHVQHVLLKLRVHSRYEAVVMGRKLNLI